MNITKIKLPGLYDYFTQEAYNFLRTNIQFCGQDVKVIALTSCGMNEGKTILSMHVGKSLAELGKRVLVIDADMRKSVMAGRNSDAKDTIGLSEVLIGQAKLEDTIYSSQFEGFHVIFSGKYPPNPVELLNSKYFEDVLETAKKTYDYVIIDTPPLGMVIDAAVIASKCDSAMLVIGSDHVKRSQAQEVVSQLEKSGCRVLGVIFNNADKKKKGYYYRRGGHYGSYYRRDGKYSRYGKYGQYGQYGQYGNNPPKDEEAN